MSGATTDVDGYEVSTDEDLLDLELIHAYLSGQSYWAEGRPLEVVRRSIENSLCFGVYWSGAQVGFARVVTDCSTFAWLCDVFVLDEHAGKGVGRMLLEHVMDHPSLRNLGHFVLATRDAHEFYMRYGGFKPLDAPQKWMIKRSEQG